MGETEILAVDDPGAGLEARRRRVPDYPIHLGPATHLAEERTLLHGLSWEHFDARMLGSTVGAVLTGIDLAGALPEPAIREIQAALDSYKVVFFRDRT